MFKHLIRLTWNKKKQNLLLILEIFFSFIGLFAGFTFVLYPYNNYKLPLGFEDENLWVANFTAADEVKNLDSLLIFRESLKKLLLPMSEIEDVTYSSVNVPFSGSVIQGRLAYNGSEIWGSMYTVEDNYAQVMGAKLLEGRWFASDDIVSKEKPVVLSETLKKELFGDEYAIGKIVESDAAHRMKVIGVVRSFKAESEAEQPVPGFFLRMDTASLRNRVSILIKVRPGADAVFESKVFKTLSDAMKGSNVEIEHFTDMKEARNKALRVAYIVFLLIACFLIINVALGIFGVLWYNIHKRRGEIGLRMAVGATGRDISKQVAAEAFMLSTLSLLLGLFFVVQFPLLGVFQLPVANYVQAIILAVFSIYVLVMFCAIYPGKQAAHIYPAEALHED
jgi:putative ABC transport system permease protein